MNDMDIILEYLNYINTHNRLASGASDDGYFLMNANGTCTITYGFGVDVVHNISFDDFEECFNYVDDYLSKI